MVLGIIIGLFVGFPLGMFTMAMISASKIAMYKEGEDERTDRKD
jgi:Na+/H+ antiporter NhaA